MMHVKWIICWLFYGLTFLTINAVQAAPIVNHWEAIQSAYFNDRTVGDAEDHINIKAPEQAENAAIVPFTFQVNLKHDNIDKVYVFTDANPILLTATFTMKVPQPDFYIATRIRLESNSVVRVVVQTTTGKLLMKTVDIKTPGGGCGGGAMTDEAKLRANAGKMKMRFIQASSKENSSVAFNIRHPMRTGFERTFQGYYAKAWFIDNISFMIDNQPYFHALLGPGISADPYFRFDLPDGVDGTFQVEAKDNEGKQFQQRFNPSVH